MISHRHAFLVVLLISSLLLNARPARAHNEIVHRNMVDYAYQTILLVQQRLPAPAEWGPLLSLPDNANPAEWQKFLNLVAAAPKKYKARNSDLNKVKPPETYNCSNAVYGDTDLPVKWWDRNLGEINIPVSIDFVKSEDCGADSEWKPGGLFEPTDPLFDRHKLDHTGAVLGFWAASVDREFDDTHLWLRPTNADAVGVMKNLLDKAVDRGLGILLLPFYCGLDCLFGDCDGCDDDARDAAEAANPIDSIDGWLPGMLGTDMSGADWVGVWHHINVRPGVSNEFDDHQGEFFEEPGPSDKLDGLDLVLMAAFDAFGVSVNHEASKGVDRYQVSNAEDGSPNTLHRSKSDWQFRSIAHTPFEPVDNLGYYGWRNFRDSAEHPISALGWPMHALGDATVPMHVTATSAWGHRPFEDAQDRLWQPIRKMNASLDDQALLARNVLLKAFDWWRFIQQWRAAHPGHDKDTPVRELVTELAKHTYSFSMFAYEDDADESWPFSRSASSLYLLDAEKAIRQYTSVQNASDRVRPLFEDGMGATLALLVSASEILPEVQ